MHVKTPRPTTYPVRIEVDATWQAQDWLGCAMMEWLAGFAEQIGAPMEEEDGFQMVTVDGLVWAAQQMVPVARMLAELADLTGAPAPVYVAQALKGVGR